MEDKHYAELANIRLERAWELVEESEVLFASEAEQTRNISDYDDFYIASKEQSMKQVQNAKKLVKR